MESEAGGEEGRRGVCNDYGRDGRGLMETDDHNSGRGGGGRG